MGIECSYSFWDLFVAAFQREPTDNQRYEFGILTQHERNRRVKLWAQKAGWGVEDRIGSDGNLYTAFCPLWK